MPLIKASQELLRQKQFEISKQTDSLFIYIFIIQFIFANLAVWLIAPKTWIGATSYINVHCYITLTLSFLLSSFPIFCAKFLPGTFFTRSVIAFAQLLYSALLIHVTGGRIETHFHVFGSLAFLTFYRDPKVLLIGTIVTALDHALRSYFYPQSVFGVSFVSHWRWVEHVLWVVFEDIFLIVFIKKTKDELFLLSKREVELEQINKRIEKEVENKTKELTNYSALLKASNEELSQFAYIASHDLREPLRGISNQASFILEDYSEELNEVITKKLNRVSALAGRMEKLLDDLLIYSRANKIQMSFDMVDLNLIIDDLKVFYEDKLDTGFYQINIDHILPVINCDKVRVGELFRNLIENAFKYNEEEEKHIHIGFCLKKDLDMKNMDKDILSMIPDNEKIFYIKDNGIGIEETNFTKIFQIFTRLHKKNDYGGGTGSGLTLVKKIIDRHNGSIWLDSKLGEFTCFYFHFNESSRALVS